MAKALASNGFLVHVDDKPCIGCKQKKSDDKPKVKYTSSKDVGYLFWAQAIKTIGNMLDYMEEFDESGVDGIPQPEVFAALQDKTDQVLERLWLKSNSIQ